MPVAAGASSRKRSLQLDAERVHHLQRGSQFRVASLAERTIEGLAGDSCFAGQLGHSAARTRHRAQRFGEVTRIVGLKSLCQVRRNRLIVGEKIGCVKGFCLDGDVLLRVCPGPW